MDPRHDESVPEHRGLSGAATAYIGFAGGVVGALLGGGTGVVTIPLLDRRLPVSRVMIHGTASIANSAVAVVGSTLLLLRGGHVDMTTGIGLMVGGVLGAVVGAQLAAGLSDYVLRVAFTIVLTLAGVELLANSIGFGPSTNSGLLPPVITEHAWASTATGVVFGIAVGAWSAAMGLGGGSLTVPILVLLYGIDPHTAEGTSLLVMLPNSVVAAFQHRHQGTALTELGVRLGAGACVGAVGGVMLSLALPPRVLAAVFGLFVLFIALWEGQKIRRKPDMFTGEEGADPSDTL